MNWIDLLLILILVLSAWQGFKQGLITAGMSLIGWLVSLYLSILLFPPLANLIEAQMTNRIFILILAFVLLMTLIRFVIFLLVGRLIDATPEELHDNVFNKIFGVVPGIINGVFVGILVSLFFYVFSFSDKLGNEVDDSAVAQRFSRFGSYLERELAPDFADILQQSVDRMSITNENTDFIKLDFKVTDPTPRPDLEAEMLELVNAEREKEGLKPLRADPKLADVARAHSRDMFARSYFSHRNPENQSPFDRIKEARVRFMTAGENLAIAPTLSKAHQGLMKSPGHRANILHPAFGRLGIGILDGGIYGIMVTQNFRN